jgi:integrase
MAIARGCDAAFPLSAELARRKVKGHRGPKDLRWETDQEWKARLGEKWADVQRWREAHRWHPHQLRHNAATRLRKQYGLEAARVVLGQKSGAVAEIYAEIDLTKAEKIMAEVG